MQDVSCHGFFTASMFWRKCVYRFPDHGRYMTTVWGADGRALHYGDRGLGPSDDRRSAMLPSALRRGVVLSSCALTVTVVSPRPPWVGETSKPLPSVVSDHGSFDVTVNVASEPAVLRNTTSFCVVISRGRSTYFPSHPASQRHCQQQAQRAPDICRYGVLGC